MATILVAFFMTIIGNKRAEYFNFSLGELNFKKAQSQDKNQQQNLFDNLRKLIYE